MNNNAEPWGEPGFGITEERTMVPLTLTETESDIKTLSNDQLGDVEADVETVLSSERGSIVIQFSLNGTYSTQILADQSDEADQLLERITAARPLLDLLQAVMAKR